MLGKRIGGRGDLLARRAERNLVVVPCGGAEQDRRDPDAEQGQRPPPGARPSLQLCLHDAVWRILHPPQRNRTMFCLRMLPTLKWRQQLDLPPLAAVMGDVY